MLKKRKDPDLDIPQVTGPKHYTEEYKSVLVIRLRLNSFIPVLQLLKTTNMYQVPNVGRGIYK